MLLLASLWTVQLATHVAALPHAAVKRQVTQLRDHYDFIVVGGGTAGLTVADRLTEALSNSESISITLTSFGILSPSSSCM
jgi:ribulose 1,5-bisphosphate synthetase/thiazole synthase